MNQNDYDLPQSRTTPRFLPSPLGVLGFFIAPVLLPSCGPDVPITLREKKAHTGLLFVPACIGQIWSYVAGSDQT